MDYSINFNTIFGLCKRYVKDNPGRSICLTLRPDFSEIEIDIEENNKRIFDWSFNDVDELISKLRELCTPPREQHEPKKIQPKPKFEVGQTWWFLDGPDFERFPEPKCMKITEENKNRYRADEEWYPTKEALIDAQIKYWTSLKNEEKSTNPQNLSIESIYHILGTARLVKGKIVYGNFIND